MTPNKITKVDALREIWSRGNLSWKMHDIQKKMLASYIAKNQEITVIASSRRLGKSYMLCILATEMCLKKPGAIVKYVCPKKSQVKTIIQPIMTDIIKDCPGEMKPEFKANEYLYQFPNGSKIQMAGTDNGHHESLRGSKSDLWIVDEAGYCDELDYVVKTILAPTADTTGGRGILASTPAKTPDHDFNVEYLKPAEYSGDLIKFTIYDNPMMSKAKIQQIIDRYHLKEKDPEFRREYLCEIVSGGDMMIVPEFTEELQRKIVKEHQRPPFYDAYVGMDIGGTDLTAVLFGYYDFINATIVIEDELAFGKKQENGAKEEFRIDKFAEAVDKVEKSLWTNPISAEFKPPYLRISDNNNVIFLNDLLYKYNLSFIPTKKTNRDASINEMRVLLSGEKILIHPRCTGLIFALRNGMWAKNKKDFMRHKTAGHWDHLAALIYLVRNVQKTKNPYPANYGFGGHDHYFTPQKLNQPSKTEQAWIEMFRSRKSLKQT